MACQSFLAQSWEFLWTQLHILLRKRSEIVF